ncbi:MAG TPA: YdeI family protein [Saprospiraceae bacterium]|nr:YdeI/OmpD-associated family protein [Lewinellaceae bacterium]HPG09118.1 YdeI family protein [Saprospiraceae bacterium]HPR00388.1 YdeI family protein [Saprospiraceae bacterium]HRV85855.1 YdeI family protein [Saprospiraceae bacterium]
MNKVDAFLIKAKKWREEFEALRAIVLDCDLTEDFKWMHPCYTYQGANIVVIHGFKEYCALLFFKGALLEDTHNLLIQQTENVQSARQIRFSGLEQIKQLAPTLQMYIYQAIEVEKAGLKVAFKKTTEYQMPEEFQQKLEAMPALKDAFDALTPGRQRGYLYYFSQAKQSKTRAARVEKWIPQILAGKGLED